MCMFNSHIFNRMLFSLWLPAGKIAKKYLWRSDFLLNRHSKCDAISSKIHSSTQHFLQFCLLRNTCLLHGRILLLVQWSIFLKLYENTILIKKKLCRIFSGYYRRILTDVKVLSRACEGALFTEVKIRR